MCCSVKLACMNQPMNDTVGENNCTYQTMMIEMQKTWLQQKIQADHSLQNK